MSTCNDLNERLMKRRLVSCEVDEDLLHRSGLDYQIRYSLSRRQHQSKAQNCDSINDDICTFKSSSAALKQQPGKKKVLSTSFRNNPFQTINVNKLSHTTSNTWWWKLGQWFYCRSLDNWSRLAPAASWFDCLSIYIGGVGRTKIWFIRSTHLAHLSQWSYLRILRMLE